MPSPPPLRRNASRLNRLAQAKLTPGVAALFFVALALMCAAAAGIGYVAQQMRHTGVHHTPG